MLEKLFEGFLWRSRWIVIVAVIASLLTGFSVFYIATVDAWMLLSHLGDYLDPLLIGEARAEFRATQITHVVEIIDGYLLATVLLIFSLGLYELFISPIDEAEGSTSSSRVLIIHSLDELKSRLAKVVMMILIVKFFEHALHMPFVTPMDILAFAGGIALIGLALYLSHAGEHPPTSKGDQGH